MGARDDSLVGGRWAWFAGSALLTAGAYNAMWGTAALAGESYFTPDELLLDSMDEQTWGAITLVWGVALAATALLVYGRRRLGLAVGTALAGSNIIVQVLSIKAFPAWAVAAILVDLLLIYALRRVSRDGD